MRRMWVVVMVGALCQGLPPAEAQTSSVAWWAFSGGAGTMAGAVAVRSVVGQPFAGRIRSGGTQIVSGFFADTLLSGPLTGVQAETPLAARYALYQNYPNPFNPSTTIRYAVARTGQVDLSLFNLLGQRVLVLVHGPAEAGEHEVRMDASGLPSGTYFLRIMAGEFSQVRRLVLMK